jgi:hypothetical protein
VSAVPCRLTVAEALKLTRGELIDRLYEESDRWKARPPRTDAQHAAYAEFTRCLHLIDMSRVIASAMDHVNGVPNGYLEQRPEVGP